MSEVNELARHLKNRSAALRLSEDLNMPEILEAYDRHMEAQRIDQAQIAFAKDVMAPPPPVGTTLIGRHTEASHERGKRGRGILRARRQRSDVANEYESWLLTSC